MAARRGLIVVALSLVAATAATACSGGGGDTLTVYSGRSEELVAPLIMQFEDETGIDVAVRYAGSAELAATILEEGDNTPADVFFAQDPASLGSVAQAGLFTILDAAILDLVPARFSDSQGRWTGVSGRARVVVYDATVVAEGDLPATEDDLTAPEWAGKVAIAPTNGSFLAFIAAKILLDGEAATLSWLEAMAANDAKTYPSNSVIVAAVDDGEVETGLANHYYLFRRIAEEGEVVAQNHFTKGGAASLVMPSGAGVMAASGNQGPAKRFVEFLLSTNSQTYFAEETFEYPLIPNVVANSALPPIDSLNAPDIDLSRLADVLDLATDLVAQAGLL